MLVLLLFWLSQTWPVTLRIWEWVFSGCTVLPDSKETEHESSDQEASPSVGKNTGVVLVPCLLFLVVWIFLRSLYVICYDRWVLSEGHKNCLKDRCLMNSQPTFLFLTYFKLKELWPYQKHVNQIILNHITLKSLALQMLEAFIRILLIVNLSLSQTFLTFLVCVRQTWMSQLILAISMWEVIFL